MKHSQEHNAHSNKIRVGDDVAVTHVFQDCSTNEFCKIDQLLEVTDSGGNVKCWAVPIWFWKCNGRRTLRKTQVVCIKDERGVPISCSTIIEQVLFVHQCNRTDRSLAVGVCEFSEVCKQHKSPDCNHAECSGEEKIIRHVCELKKNPFFEVVDPAFGFVEKFVRNREGQ